MPIMTFDNPLGDGWSTYIFNAYDVPLVDAEDQVESSAQLVSSRFNLSALYAEEAWDLAKTMLGQIGAGVTEIDDALRNNVFDSSIEYDVSRPAPGDPTTPQRPGEYTSSFDEITLPSVQDFITSMGLVEVNIDDIVIPDFDGVFPTPDYGDAPSDEIPAVPDDVPTVSAPDLPAVPDYDIPTAVEVSDIVLPAEMEISVPTFDADGPTVSLDVPSVAFNFDEVPYDSQLVEDLRAWFLNQIEEGGTGLTSTVEDAIFQLAIDRMTEQNLAKYDEVEKYWASRGHYLPVGALAARVDEVINEIDREETRLSLEIMVEQARLAQTNQHFVIQNSVGFEQMLMDYSNKVNQRSFESAKYATEAALALYNARIAAFQLELEEFKAHAAVFEALVRAEIAKTEIYRAQIEGVKATVEVEALRVQAYTARLQSNQTLVDLYRAEMEGAKLKVETEIAAIEGFKARIDGVAAAINGVTAKYNMYNARISGEVAKIDGYKSQAQAYAALVDATKAQADVNIAEADVAIKNNTIKIDALKAAIAQYQADIGYEVAKEETAIKGHEAQVKLYEADIKDMDSWRSATIGIYGEDIKGYAAYIDAQIRDAKNSIDYALGSYQVATSMGEIAARVSGTMAAAALSSVSANSSYSHSTGVSASQSNSLNTQFNYQQSESLNYNQSESASRDDDKSEVHYHTYKEK